MTVHKQFSRRKFLINGQKSPVRRPRRVLFQLRLSPHRCGEVASLVGELEEAHCAPAFENETIPIEANAGVATIATLNVVLKPSPLLPTARADGRALNPAVCLCALLGR